MKSAQPATNRALSAPLNPNDHRLAFIVAAVGAGGMGLLLFAATVVSGLLTYLSTDVFALQTGGAAFLGFAVAMGMEATANRPTRIVLAGGVAAALGTALGAAIALLGPTGGKLGLSALVAGVGIAWMLGYLLLRSVRTAPTDDPLIGRWFTGFLVWGSVASALFGFGGLLLGGTFGKLFGFAGTYDLLYRLAGGVTLGIFVGSVLSVRSRAWLEVRPLVVVGFITNLLTLLGGLADASHGGNAAVGVLLICAAAGFNTIGLGLGLLRRGK